MIFKKAIIFTMTTTGIPFFMAWSFADGVLTGIKLGFRFAVSDFREYWKFIKREMGR